MAAIFLIPISVKVKSKAQTCKKKFNNCSLNETVITKSNILQCDFSGADFIGTVFKTGNFMKNTLENIQWNLTSFIEMQLQDITFTGTFNECTFENCGFYTANFENATLINTFFKNNRKFKRVKFINCKVDKITYAFLKNNLADLKGLLSWNDKTILVWKPMSYKIHSNIFSLINNQY
ncbi:MAG: pentapeptide repeat-containing protein [Bacteroidetes bacterium]|nr:pentapeptide repeat-containing protein [Bacteroidota bacterium]